MTNGPPKAVIELYSAHPVQVGLLRAQVVVQIAQPFAQLIKEPVCP